MKKILFSLAAFALGIFAVPQLQQHIFTPCSNYQGLDSCKSGQQVDYPQANEGRRWQTPPPGHPLYASPEWQHYRNLQGYANVVYNADRTSAKVSVITFVRKESKLLFKFGNADWTEKAEFSVPKAEFESDFAVKGEDAYLDGLKIDVWAPDADNATLSLDPVSDIMFPRFTLETGNGKFWHDFKSDGSGAIVELFGWPFADVAKECESHIGKAGYMGVKIFPAQEHVESDRYLQNGELNPWWFSYQPISYRLNSRLGTREELRKMILTCRKHGVRVYSDAVVNHMSGSGNDVLFHRTPAGGGCNNWGPKNSSGNSPYFTHSWAYEVNEFTGERPGLEFPAVPYGPTDFHCERSMNSWADGFQLNYGWLVGLTDLNTGKPYVQQRIADFFTDLLGMGFSGFRVDAAKHIRPDDLSQIFAKFKTNVGSSYPADFITWLEVIIGGEKDLLACHANPYNFYSYFDNSLKQAGLSNEDVQKIKIWSSDYPKEHPICGNWVIPATRFAIQNDDHDQQNPGSSSRDMADKGAVLIKERDIGRHRGFEKQLFERTDADWAIRLILSSYTFMNTGVQGYPDGKSDCARYKGNPFTSPHEKCRTVPFAKAHDPETCGYSMVVNGQWKEGAYTRVHRDKQIILAMRRWSGLSTALSNSELGLPSHCQ